MRSLLIIGFLIALGVAPAAQALVQCQITAVPLQMRANGLAEPVGDIVLRCAGGVPFSPVTGSFQVAISGVITNRPDDQLFNEIALSIDTTSIWQQLTSVRTRSFGANAVLLDNVNVAFDANGLLGLRISGIRTETDGEIRALISHTGAPQLPVPFATVVVGRATGAGIGAVSTATFPSASLELPPDADFATLVSLRVPFLTTRFTESGPAVLRPRGNQHETAVRVVVAFPGVPAPGRVVVPAAIAGSNALQPTSGGNLGSPVAGGQYLSVLRPSLLLGLVRGADPNGLGGNLAFTPGHGINTLTRVEPADVLDGLHYAVYEVLDAEHGALESAQFPAWIVMPPDWRSGGPVLRSQVSLGPVSTARGALPTAAVPRFSPNIARNDCPIVDDCAAAYFPRLRTVPISPSEFTAPSGSGHQIGSVIVENTGGDLLEWRVSVRYLNGAGWVRFFPAAGVDRATVRYDVLPVNLPPGEYRAELVITAAANGGETVLPILLRVTAPLPPVEPPPVIRDVVNAANRIPGPVAPGSLAYVLGERFHEEASVTVGGIPARVLLAEPGELLIQIPPSLDPSPGRAIVRVNAGGRQSAPWGVETAAVAPAILFALNEDDGERNAPAYPVVAGRILQLFVTGIDAAVIPVFVRIHDRDITDLLRGDGVEQPVGARVLRFVVPEDLPTMSTAVLVCARASEGAEPVCAQPFDVSLRQAP